MPLYISRAKLRKGWYNWLSLRVSSVRKWKFSFNLSIIKSRIKTNIIYFKIPNTLPNSLLIIPRKIKFANLVNNLPMIKKANTAKIKLIAIAIWGTYRDEKLKKSRNNHSLQQVYSIAKNAPTTKPISVVTSIIKPLKNPRTAPHSRKIRIIISM